MPMRDADSTVEVHGTIYIYIFAIKFKKNVQRKTDRSSLFSLSK